MNHIEINLWHGITWRPNVKCENHIFFDDKSNTGDPADVMRTPFKQTKTRKKEKKMIWKGAKHEYFICLSVHVCVRVFVYEISCLFVLNFASFWFFFTSHILFCAAVAQ